ncbi:putative transmembrane protein [Advenella mimigardefordensis DPN7]|uniref:Putative transmembrane protein n=1 Tax=Advenella mimigardefordensis (strain DSM 17166 / LMG 22922 / DPN7) TaxID=1247726 RepID=W0PGL6_ADVMD|nr:putative transmembrane protein [Advenella mimigardefordensis DPN7]
MHIKNQQDFWSGLMFVAIGLGFAIFSLGYDMGTPSRMGPGYFPFWLAVCMALLGAVVTLTALRGEATEDSSVGHFDWDILFMIIGSICLYGLMLDHLGLYIATPLLVIFCSLASHEFSLMIAVGNAVFLTVFSWLAFVKGLGLIFPLWPEPFAEWSIAAQILIPVGIVIAVVMLVRRIKGK